jgi:excisionase family DNA binding protein
MPQSNALPFSPTRLAKPIVREEGSLTGMTSTGNIGLDALADAIAGRVLARLNQSGASRLCSVDEAAAYIGRSPKALRHMIANGTMAAVREGGRIHLDRVDLDQWIELRKTRG